MENGWVSVGTHFSERVCKLHQEIEGGRYGKPSWGFDQYNHPQICCDDPDEVVWAKTLALSESITWNDARDACKKDGLSLCPASVYCPEGPGKSPAGGITEGDHWAPSGDYPNSWVSVGSYDAARRVCRQHDALFGPPAWGSQPSTYAFKGHVRCCARDDACKSMPCANGSKCVAGKGDSYKCVCKKGFVGKDCAVENKCANGKKSPCKNGGSCESIGDAGGYRCDCKPGFSGKHCGKKDACSLSPCKNGADCKNDTTVKRGFKCACKPGFGGKTCARRDPCTSSPCKNGAKCVRDSATKFHCKCPAGFRGKRCGVNIDDCTPEAIKSCKNGGKCVDGINSFTCDCAGTKFAGPACTSYPMTGFVNVVGGTGELFIDDDQRNNDLGAKTVNVKSFALPGSTVEISAKLNPNGQTGIIASFKFRKATYTTGTDWECSVDGGKTYRRARAVEGRELPEGFAAQSPAKYIWVKNQNAKEVTCRMRLPMKHLASGTRIVLPVKNTIGPLCSRSNGASITYFYGEVCPNGGVQWNHMHTKNRRAGLKQSQCAWSRKAMKDNAAWLANWLGSCNEPPKMLFPKLPTSRASFYTKANVEEDSCKANPCASTATCKSSRFGPMPFKCTCNKGFTGDGKSCVEVDNCAKNPCDKNAKCRKTGPGKHECTCRKGFIGTGEKCEPLNNCKNAKSPCSPRATCTMTGPGQHKCACKTGYKGNGRHCKAINNCRLKNKPCHKHAVCAPTGPGQHKCTCKKGRKGDGVKKCKSINPCKKGKGKGKGKGPCDTNAKCFHTGPNKYRCECAKGFKGNGKQCKEVNLCKSSKPCHGSATCTHTGPGKYTCQCLKGFDGDGKSCVEVDMCSRSKPCDANGLCSKTGPGTFKCACKEGFKGNGKVCKEVNICRSANPCDKNAKCKKTGPGVASCKCNKGYNGDGKACKAIDKCEKKPCDPNSVCESTGPGKFKCTCNKGFEAAGNSRTKCREVDACKKKPCDGHATCTATGPGTYKCACEKGFKGDGFSCAEINDCDTAGLCNENANCQKTGPGKHQCTCKAGFKGDGKHCSEMDVCAGNPCDKHATCAKGATPGNHVCKCANGYEGDGKTCTAVDNCKKKPCGDHSVCKATGAGTHTCSCEKGFRLKDGVCNAIRGCQERTAPAHATCVETGPGRLVFKCDAGYKWSRAAKGCVAVNGCDKKGACSADAACEATGPGTVKCTCKKGFDGDGKTCAKVDSCKSNPCGKGEACTSTGPGTHKCACAKGHRRSKANAAECVAVNNCADAKEAKKDICGKHGTCSYKGPGVHACTCNSGYARVSVPAKKLGEKPRAACVEKKGCASSPCSKFATCTEKGKGAFECKCNDKFVGDGVKCEVQPGFKAVTIAGKATIVPITTGDKHDTDLAIITERLSKLAVDDITPPTPTAAAPVAGAAPVKAANVMDRSGLKAATEKVLALETNTAQMLAQAKAETEALKALQKQSKQESDRLLKLMESRTDSILDAAVDATHAVLTHTPHPEGQHKTAKKAESSATTVV